MATRMFSAANGRPLAVNPQLAKEAGRKPEGNPETATATERDERRRAVENDRVASRRATEGSRGKRRRGGGLGSEGPL
jgi:hypothetical protein